MKRFIAVFIAVLGFNFLSLSLSAFAARIVHLKIQGGINPATQNLVERGIQKAAEIKAEAVLIQLNTPGGLLTSTRSIVQMIFESEVPVIVYVSPSGAHAGSAGVMITLASHVAAMAPGTNIGAAHPVSGQGKDIEGDLAEKVTNDAVAWVESIAKTRKRNPKWAAEAVRRSVSIDNERALKLGVIEHVAVSVPKLLEKIDGTTVLIKEQERKLNTRAAELIPLEFTLKEKVIDVLSNPNIAYILMMVGMVGIYIELSHPGAIFPGVIGAISLLVSFICLQALPINYGGLALLFLGLALLIAELFMPSFGILGLGGIVSLLLGSIFLVDPAITGLTISLSVILPTVLTLGGIMFVIAVFVYKALRKKRAMGEEALVGAVGSVVTAFEHRQGKVFVDGDYWSAVSDDSLDKNDAIIVTEIKGMILTVKKKT